LNEQPSTNFAKNLQQFIVMDNLLRSCSNPSIGVSRRVVLEKCESCLDVDVRKMIHNYDQRLATSSVNQRCYCDSRNGKIGFCEVCKDLKNMIMNQIIGGKNESVMQIRCETKSLINQVYESCNWVGSIDDYPTHLRHFCFYAKMKCPNRNCGVTMIRKFAENHVKNMCLFREVKCEYCFMSVVLKNIEKHYRVECQEIIEFRKQKNYVSSILKKCEKLTEIEQFYLHKWIHKCTNTKDFKNLEVLDNELEIESFKNLNNKNNKILMKNNLLFEFKVRTNTNMNKDFLLFSPTKVLFNRSLKCFIFLNNSAQNKNITIDVNHFDNKNIKKIKTKITFISFPNNNSYYSSFLSQYNENSNHTTIRNDRLVIPFKDFLKYEHTEKDGNNIEYFVARILVSVEITV
jgi:hypothetical protein